MGSVEAETITNGDINGGNVEQSGASKGPKKLTIEKIYQKKTQLEHILLRPDTYIGSVEQLEEVMWVYDIEKQLMDQRKITYVPGLYKIFDEILVNAADNKQRCKSMDCIKVEINPTENYVSVWNNGEGIPVKIHGVEKVYVPTMIFGMLLTSSNYNDEEEKVTGGRNGYGAKLCNIFSTKFIVETASKKDKKSFKQMWTNNMTKNSEPKIKDYSGEDFTKITFYPDLSKFKMEKLDKDIVELMSRRAFDIAASTKGVKVFLNGKRLPVKNFKEYAELYLKDKEDDFGNPIKIVYEECNPRWEVAFALSNMGFQQVSFVNSIATTKGGRHVDYLADTLVKNLRATLTKKNKGGFNVQPFQIKNHMWLFINCLIVNPTFDSQTKENMTTQVKNFGSKCTLSDKFIANVTKSGISEAVLQLAKMKADAQLAKSCSGKKQNKLKGVPKLEDANDAGTNKSLDCTLILTEGDSAKSLAVSGLGVVGRDKYGVFPLRGKLLNVREASHKQISENAEIVNIIKILGLQYKKKYETVDDLRSLRYGRLMIMTDQDQDGSHIKGLIINFIHTNWPSLLRLPFLEEFITPIVKASKGREELSFYSLPEFEEWKSGKDNWHTYKIKYYKGLGTSTSKEAKAYFSDMQRHRIKFKYGGPQDDANINMAFSKKYVNERKEWLTNWMEDTKRRREMGLPEQYLYEKDTKQVNYSDFVNKELVLFSNLDNERSIPSMVDGLKPGQRKVLFTVLKRNDKREIKVAQLAGSVAEHSAYHHGEQSLMSTIINLAQNYVGSNNINLLQPIGQFGTRLVGGKDAASPRYIFTMLSPLTRTIFHPHDEPLLTPQYDDNQKIEPLWYLPIIPMILVNGADGIGTGWMTKIPNYNPREIVENLRLLIKGEEPKLMNPWYKNFKGSVVPVGSQRYVIYGEVAIIGSGKVEITELPIGTWTQAYKESVLEPLLHGSGDKSPPQITDYKEYNTDTTIRFVITMTEEKLRKAEEEGLHKFFKLMTSISTTSMCAFDHNSVLRKFEEVSEILNVFFKLRLEYYEKRKVYLEGMLQAESLKLSNQARFILEKCSGELTVENKKKKVMIEELKKRGYEGDPVKSWKMRQNRNEALEELQGDDSQVEEDDKESTAQYDYLLGMTMWTLTLERKNELLKKRDEKLQELKTLQAKTPADIWVEDLDHFIEQLDKLEEEEKAEANEGMAASSAVLKLGKTKGAPSKAKKQALTAVETLPSPVGRRIEPKIDEELKKKFEKASQAAKGRKTKKNKEPEEKDEFDALGEDAAKPLADRIGISPDMIEKKVKAKKKELKQTKLNFKPVSKSPKKKKDRWDSNSEDESSLPSDFEDEGSSAPVAPTRTTSRRAAATKKYTFDSDSDEDDGNEEVFDNELLDDGNHVPVTDNALDDSEDEAPPSKNNKVIDVSDTDSDFDVPKSKAKKPQKNTDALFDSLLSDSAPSETPAPEPEEPKKEKSAPKRKLHTQNDDNPKRKKAEKPPAEKKKKTVTKKPKRIDSDESDEDIFSSKPAKSKRKKKGSDEDDEFSDNVEEIAVPRRSEGSRARKQVKYTFDDDDEEDDDDGDYDGEKDKDFSDSD